MDNDDLITVLDSDGYWSSKIGNNRAFIEEVRKEGEEPYLLLTNTTECLSSEDGCKERRYHNFKLTPPALMAMVDVALRYLHTESFREFLGGYNCATEYLHNKYKSELAARERENK